MGGIRQKMEPIHTAMGTNAVIETKTPISYLHLTIKSRSIAVQSVPKNYNTFVYVLNGRGMFGSDNQVALKGQMVLFKNDGDQVQIREASTRSADNDDNDDKRAVLDVLLIGGVPLKEPIARYGPFVMNTQDEIYQAIEDYRSARYTESHNR